MSQVASMEKELAPELKQAMVTGATGILGQATVKMLLSEGFRVVIHDVNVEALNTFVDSLGNLASRTKCYPICFDASKPESVSEACKRILEEFGPVYVLVNNNGFLSNTGVLDTTPKEWKRIFAQNVDSVFLVSRELLPQMKSKKFGRIINTCSLAGKTGGVNAGIAYSTSKGALQTLTFGLARESARDGITVNAIAPAYLRTSTLEHYPPEIVERLLETIPVGRFCEPEEYAHTVRFLISPLAGFITGEVIDMNGGLLMD